MLVPYTATVQADGQATWGNVPGVAFTLTPASGGRYPVSVVLDEEAATRTYVVCGPNEERGAVPFSRVRLVGGVPGDVWTLHVGGAADLRRHGYRQDGRGRALVHVAAGDVLASVDFTLPTSLPADGGTGQSYLYLPPGGSGFVAPTGTALDGPDPLVWDVREHKRLRFSYAALAPASNQGSGQTSLQFFVEAFTSPIYGVQPLFTLGLGTTNQFVDQTGTQPIASVVAWLETGAPVESSSTLIIRSAHGVNYLRVRLGKNQSGTLSPDFLSRPPSTGPAIPTRCMGRFTVESL